MKNLLCLWNACIHLAAGIFLSGNTLTVSASESEIVCTESLSSENFHIVNPPVAWKPFVSSLLDLSAVGISYGPPESKEVAKPYSAVKTKSGSVVKWILSHTANSEAWVNCSYGKDGAFNLSQTLASDLKECTAIYKNLKDGESSLKFNCK